MIKYIVKGDLEKRTIEAQYFYSSKNPIEAREEAFSYFLNLVEILEDSGENLVIETEYSLEDGSSVIIPKKLGVELVCIINEKDEFTLDFYGNFYETMISNDIAHGLREEYEFYLKHNFDTKNYVEKIKYCDSEFFEEDGTESFYILKTSYNLTEKDKAYWWLNIEEKRELIKNLIEERKLENSLINGESNTSEFKPALVYNFKTKTGSIGVKHKIAKSICGFLNSNGGYLHIGVNDNKEIIGLEPDFSLCDKNDEFDWFKLEFDNMIFQFFDESVWNYIKADFNREQETIFFTVKILPSNSPYFVRNNRTGTKEFYIRNTASTKEIKDIEEIIKYSLSHWKTN